MAQRYLCLNIYLHHIKSAHIVVKYIWFLKWIRGYRSLIIGRPKKSPMTNLGKLETTQPLLKVKTSSPQLCKTPANLVNAETRYTFFASPRDHSSHLGGAWETGTVFSLWSSNTKNTAIWCYLLLFFFATLISFVPCNPVHPWHPYGCFLKWWYPHFTPQVLIIFSRTFPMVVGFSHHCSPKPPSAAVHNCPVILQSFWTTVSGKSSKKCEVLPKKSVPCTSNFVSVAELALWWCEDIPMGWTSVWYLPSFTIKQNKSNV